MFKQYDFVVKKKLTCAAILEERMSYNAFVLLTGGTDIIFNQKLTFT
jgi:hypothetical protein